MTYSKDLQQCNSHGGAYGELRQLKRLLFLTWTVVLGKILIVDNLQKQSIVIVSWYCAEQNQMQYYIFKMSLVLIKKKKNCVCIVESQLSTSYFTVQWHDTFGHLCCILGYAKDCAADAGLLERKISLSQAIQDLESNSIVCVCVVEKLARQEQQKFYWSM